MTVQYQIMEVGTTHLKKYEGLRENQDRVCFRPAKLDNCYSNICDSFEEAVKRIEMNGDDHKEYTIIPRIYMTDFDEQ